MSHPIKTRAWWVAAGYRTARTALTVIVGFLTVDVTLTEVAWVPAASAAVLAAILSIATSFINLPEASSSNTPKWLAVLLRSAKTFVQSLLSLIPTSAVFLDEVNWGHVLDVSLVATVGSLILGLVSVLPETSEPEKVVAAKPASRPAH